MRENARFVKYAAFLILLAFPIAAVAQDAGIPANAKCKAECTAQKKLADEMKDPSLNCIPVGTVVKTCQATTPGGTVTGQCMMFICEAKNAPGQKGGNALDQGMSKLGEILGKLMEMLKQGQQGGSTPPPTSQPGVGQGCTTYTQSSDPNVKSNPTLYPCLYYVEPISGSLGTAGSTGTSVNTGSSIADLLGLSNNPLTGSNVDTSVSSLLGQGTTSINSLTSVPFLTTNAGTTGTSVSTGGSTLDSLLPGQTGQVISSLLTGIVSDLNGASTGVSVSTGGSDTEGSSTSSPQAIAQAVVQGPLGAYGDIKLLGNGTTIVFGNKQSDTQVAGFYGSESSSAPPQGIVSSLCKKRPWASGFISYIVPPSFFDGLCSLRGYQATVQPQPQVQITQTPTVRPSTPAKATSTPPAATSTTSAVQARVDIWAAPEQVPLGARTSVFWNTQGVTSCTETSPDGNFAHSSLSGGASTVPLSHETVFTISCLDSNSNPVTDSVTVRMSI